MEVYALLFSAVIHDVDHPGLNNSFAIKTCSPLAILYNDVSVLENHHVSLGFSIMKSSSEYDILDGWDQCDIVEFRKLVIACVLSTDMNLHNDMVKEIKNIVIDCRVNDFSDTDRRFSFYRYILHGADISNSVRSHQISYKISLLIVEEFRTQAKLEAECGVTVTPHMILPDEISIAKSEIGFLEFVAKPYWIAMSLCYDSLSELIPKLNSNLDNWKSRLQLLQNN